ncbi:MAG: hypothetical protein K0Q79_1423 [Flavipsychrobacter sp.]|nr:hypothetical protein [Flavipsychrobacter sp.]
MWDGFWVRSFKRGTLVISCSFDRIYYREFDLVFKQVVFFNVPAQWRDTNVDGDDLLRLAPAEEFAALYPDVEIGDRAVFAIDMHLDVNRVWQPYTFYIVARHIYLNKCTPEDNDPGWTYEDPINDVQYPCMLNRVLPRSI